MGTIYPRSDHYPPHPEISNKDFYFAVMCYTGGNSSGKKIEPIFSKSSGNPIFSEIFGHQGAENEARNTKMYRGQETHPIRINAGMKWIEPLEFSKISGNPIFGQIFGHQRAENEARNKKTYGGHATHSIRVNARYEMNWANSYFKKFRKPHFQPNIWPPEGQKWG